MLLRNGKDFKINGVIYNQYSILLISTDNCQKRQLSLKELMLFGEQHWGKLRFKKKLLKYAQMKEVSTNS